MSNFHLTFQCIYKDQSDIDWQSAIGELKLRPTWRFYNIDRISIFSHFYAKSLYSTNSIYF